MSKVYLKILVVVMVAVLPISQSKAQDPIAEAIKQGVIKVIKAIDLRIQRIQNKTIWLQNAQKVIENKMTELKLTEIKDWVEKQRKLYADYFDELWQIKNTISSYHRVKDLVRKQIQLVEDYKLAFGLFKKDKNFTEEEIAYMFTVYSGIFEESVKNIDALYLVAKSFSTQMSDADRLEIINYIADNIDENVAHLRQFTRQNKIISMQRAIEKNDIESVKKLYGL